MNNPLVSIIIPTYNRAHLIGETLDSVLEQTYKNWECLIIDDGSTDLTEHIVLAKTKLDHRFQFHKRPENKPKGANTCRNLGLDLSHGDYIMFLDSDDLLAKSCLEYRIMAFKNNPELDFVIANTAYYTNGEFNKQPICDYNKNTSAKTYLSQFLSYNLPWTIMSVLWKKSIIKNIRFDEQLLRFQDLDFHIQILLQENLNCMRLNEIDNYYRSELNTKNTKAFNIKVIESFTVFLEKYLIKHLLNNEQKQHFRTFIILFLTKFIYPFQFEAKKANDKIDEILKKSQLFNSKELKYLLVYKFIYKIKLNKVKGIGVHKLTKLLKKKLRYV
ncbi:glycosyltransferase family 2 protein [Bizionia saleffrena]|uniref:Glycosyltransferase family 2 protein n=1 Tax=Bizionia saleffrena TaxID=291189 RepID=A0A8H2LF52_9FLAO|nr:glycosyltransferase family 2 protein [Bizionia saleffrena]TYB80170.1 glycosyltransferase family 2 protein [Bizionia saleffrena]